jgi:hypothetical protein
VGCGLQSGVSLLPANVFSGCNYVFLIYPSYAHNVNFVYEYSASHLNVMYLSNVLIHSDGTVSLLHS